MQSSLERLRFLGWPYKNLESADLKERNNIVNLDRLQEEAVTATAESLNSADHRTQATVYQLDEAINSIIFSVQDSAGNPWSNIHQNIDLPKFENMFVFYL